MDIRLRDLVKEVNSKLEGYSGEARRNFMNALISLTPEHQQKSFRGASFVASKEKINSFKKISDAARLLAVSNITPNDFIAYGFKIQAWHVSENDVSIDMETRMGDMSVSFTKELLTMGETFIVEVHYPDIGGMDIFPSSKKYSMIEHVFSQDGLLGVFKMMSSDDFYSELIK